MEILWLVLGGIFAVVGLLGTVLPVLPGAPLAYATLWMMWLADPTSVSVTSFVVMGILMVILTILDYVAPIWLTRRGGGTKYGERGATIGLVVGLFLGPLGIIFGPFVGALIGELLAKTPRDQAIKVAFMSFAAFLLTTGLKLIYCLAIIWMFVASFFN